MIVARLAGPCSSSVITSRPASKQTSSLRGSIAGTDGAAHRRDAHHLEGGRHRVRGELAAAGARPRAGGVLELGQLVVVDVAGGVRADRLEHVLDRHVAGPGSGPGAIEPP